MTAYFELYEPLLTESGTLNVQFQMRITDATTGEVKTDTGFRTADSYIHAGNPVVPIAEEITINTLPTGSYRLEVRASDTTGKYTDWRASNFTID
jgi:hypothetical protein